MFRDAQSAQRTRLMFAYAGIAAGIWIVGVCAVFLTYAFNLVILGILIFGVLFLAFSAVRLRNLRRVEVSKSLLSEGEVR